MVSKVLRRSKHAAPKPGNIFRHVGGLAASLGFGTQTAPCNIWQLEAAPVNDVKVALALKNLIRGKEGNVTTL